jgi:NADP-dependent 3-hydroxy acid dehydrogenase YdfG
MKLDGAIAIVTGASSGIGAATAQLLANEGAHVVLAARRADRIQSLAATLGNALAVPTDVTEADDRKRLVDRTVAQHGRVDLLVNNAGQGLHVPLSVLDLGDFRAVFELNVIAALALMQVVLPQMQLQSSGAVVNVSSATSLRLVPGIGGYSATKAALNLLSQIARAEFADAGVVVSTVYPSITATEFREHLRAGETPSTARRIPPDPPELAAKAILFAASSGEAHVLVDDPPRSIVPGSDDAWAALLARQGRA